MNKIGVTEHIEADECKFALWEGTVAPISDYKLILRVFVCAQFLQKVENVWVKSCTEYEAKNVVVNPFTAAHVAGAVQFTHI